LGNIIGNSGQFDDFRWIDRVQYRVLSKIYPAGPIRFASNPYEGASKLLLLLGEELVGELKGKVVVDFGCGDGNEAVYLVGRGVARVIGVDIRESSIAESTRRAEEAGVADRCTFTTDSANIQADAIVSLDSFEHFEDPLAILEVMHGMLRPGGFVVTGFGPVWYHPYGAHSLSAFPWAHMVLTERALLRWRADLRDDGATRYGEISGGLNQMTVSRFERCVAQSAFEIEHLEAVPIRKLKWAHNRLTREFTTSIVRCRLRKK